MTLPKLACLCPTYKRPKMLQNALACFLAQDYPQNRCQLFILDDAAQIRPNNRFPGPIRITSLDNRMPDLPSKFLHLSRMAIDSGADGLVVWEDDDVFFPWHLSQIGEAFQAGVRFWQPPTVFSNYGKPKGECQIEETGGRFHSSWAYRTDVFVEVGGYPQTGRLDFDQQMGGICRKADPNPPMAEIIKGYWNTDWKWISPFYPSYCYRWGSGGWNGSQAGEEGYQAFWQRLGELPVEPVMELVPQFDEETKLLYERIQKPSHANLRGT